MFKKLTIKSPGDEMISDDGAILTRPENYEYDAETATVEIAAKHMKQLLSKGYDIIVSVNAKIPKDKD